MEGQDLPFSSAQQASGCDIFLSQCPGTLQFPQKMKTIFIHFRTVQQPGFLETFFFSLIEYSSDIDECTREAIFLSFYINVT